MTRRRSSSRGGGGSCWTSDGRALDREGCLSGEPAEVAATLAGFARAGLRHLTLYVGDPSDPSKLPALTPPMLERSAPLLEAIRAA